MKFASILAVAAIALVSFDHAHAAKECSMDDADAIAAIMDDLMSDKACVAAVQKSPDAKCPDATCYPTLEKIAAKMPDCIVNGMNAKETFAKNLKACKGSSAASRSFTVSTGVALSSAVLAVVMIYL